MTLAKRHPCRLVDILFFDRAYDVRSDYHVMVEDVMTTSAGGRITHPPLFRKVRP